jgi:hypothetical protein
LEYNRSLVWPCISCSAHLSVSILPEGSYKDAIFKLNSDENPVAATVPENAQAVCQLSLISVMKSDCLVI